MMTSRFIFGRQCWQIQSLVSMSSMSSSSSSIVKVFKSTSPRKQIMSMKHHYNYYSTTVPTLSATETTASATTTASSGTNGWMKHSLQSSSMIFTNNQDMIGHHPSMTRREYHVSSIQYQETSNTNDKDTIPSNNDNNDNIEQKKDADTNNDQQDEDEQKWKIPKYADRPKDCPDYQNPLHFNDPNKNKVFISDYPEGEAPIQRLPPLSGANSPHIRELANDILHLNMLELNELVTMVKDHFGIEDMEMNMMGGGGIPGGAGAAAADAAPPPVVEEKTTFDLKLTGYDDKSKIKVIKEIRTITALGLKEAKELVEGVPKTIKKGIKKEEAEELKTKLEAIGATVVID